MTTTNSVTIQANIQTSHAPQKTMFVWIAQLSLSFVLMEDDKLKSLPSLAMLGTFPFFSRYISGFFSRDITEHWK